MPRRTVVYSVDGMAEEGMEGELFTTSLREARRLARQAVADGERSTIRRHVLADERLPRLAVRLLNHHAWSAESEVVETHWPKKPRGVSDFCGTCQGAGCDVCDAEL